MGLARFLVTCLCFALTFPKQLQMELSICSQVKSLCSDLCRFVQKKSTDYIKFQDCKQHQLSYLHNSTLIHLGEKKKNITTVQISKGQSSGYAWSFTIGTSCSESKILNYIYFALLCWSNEVLFSPSPPAPPYIYFWFAHVHDHKPLGQF